MRNRLAALAMTGTLAFAPLVAAAAPRAGQTPGKAAETKGKHAKASHAEHVTTGTVKSIDATTLVIARSGKKHKEMTFDLGPSVSKDGTVAVGSHVSIRYHDDGSKHVATAIAARRRA